MSVLGDTTGEVEIHSGDPGDENDAKAQNITLDKPQLFTATDDGFVPVPGRSVVFCIAPDEWRPAAIVKTWTGDLVNLVVFLDGNNDTQLLAMHPSGVFPAHAGATTGWKPSAAKAATVGGWMPRIPE